MSGNGSPITFLNVLSTGPSKPLLDACYQHLFEQPKCVEQVKTNTTIY